MPREKERISDGFEFFDALTDGEVVGHLGDGTGGNSPAARGIQIEANSPFGLWLFSFALIFVEFTAIPVVKVLGDANRLPAVSGEMFGQGDGVPRVEAPGVDAVVVDDVAGTGRVDSGEDGAARRKAGRRGADRVGEYDAALGEALDVRGDGLGCPWSTVFQSFQSSILRKRTLGRSVEESSEP